MHLSISANFRYLGSNERILELRRILADLSPLEQAIAKRELLRDRDMKFDIVSSLPVEIAIRVFQYLDMTSLRNCRKTCRRWHELAQSKYVVESKIKDSETSCSQKPMYTTIDELYMWHEIREWRWDHAKPISIKTIASKSRVSAVTVRGPWFAASYDGMLRAWKKDGLFRQCLNVRLNAASTIAICPEKKVLATSSYLRECRLFSLETGNVLLQLRFAAVSIKRVDVLGSILALLMGDNRVDVRNWSSGDGSWMCRFDDGEISDIKLCPGQHLAAVSTDWQVTLIKYKDLECVAKVNLQKFISKATTPSTQPPSLKTFSVSDQYMYINTYNNRVSVTVGIHLGTGEVYKGPDVSFFDSAELLSSHLFDHLLLTRDQGGFNIYTSSPRGTSSLKVPKMDTGVSIMVKKLDVAPDICATDDTGTVLAFNNKGIIAFKFALHGTNRKWKV